MDYFRWIKDTVLHGDPHFDLDFYDTRELRNLLNILNNMLREIPSPMHTELEYIKSKGLIKLMKEVIDILNERFNKEVI